jgi:cation-transporting P-type ATPase 13A2
VKGAPEVMTDICELDSCAHLFYAAEMRLNLLWQPVPDDYDDLLSYYTKRGYRVIAMAGKSIEGLSWLKAQRMKRLVAPLLQQIPNSQRWYREQAESGLRFLGLIIFENKLKPGTAPAIQALRSAHLACRMITGDNPLTAVSVAQECNLLSQTAHVFMPTFVQGKR